MPTRIFYYKVNFDATFDASWAKSVSGVVTRNASGKVLGFKTKIHREVASLFAAEALAYLQVVIVGKQMGFKSVIIEGDSATMIKKRNSEKTDRLVIGGIIRNIKQKKQFFNTYSFSIQTNLQTIWITTLLEMR